MGRAFAALVVVVMIAPPRGALAQDQAPQQSAQDPQPASRVEQIEQQQAEKAATLTPAKEGKVEEYVTRISGAFLGGQMHWHSFFQNAYAGGGFTVGAGYTTFVSPYDTLDV